jgi:hypothetical protein
MQGKNLMSDFLDPAFIVKTPSDIDFIGQRICSQYFVKPLLMAMTGRRFRTIYISFAVSELNDLEKDSYCCDILTKLKPDGKIIYMSLQDMAKNFKCENAKYAAFVLSALSVPADKSIFEAIFYDTALGSVDYCKYEQRAVTDGYLKFDEQKRAKRAERKDPPMTLVELEKEFAELELDLGQYVTMSIDKQRITAPKIYAAMLLNIVHLAKQNSLNRNELENMLVEQTGLSLEKITKHITDAIIRGYIYFNHNELITRGKNEEVVSSLWQLAQDKDFGASPYLIEELQEKYFQMRDIKHTQLAYNCFIHNILWALNYDDDVRDYIQDNTNIEDDELDFYLSRAEADGFIVKTTIGYGKGWCHLAPLSLVELNDVIVAYDFPKKDYLISEVLSSMGKTVSDKKVIEGIFIKLSNAANAANVAQGMTSEHVSSHVEKVTFQDIALYGWNIFNERYPSPKAPIPPIVLKMKVSDMDLSRWDSSREEIKQYQADLRKHREQNRKVKAQRESTFFELLMKRYGLWSHFSGEPIYFQEAGVKVRIEKMYSRAMIVAKHNNKKATTNYNKIAQKFDEFMKIGLV